VVSIPILRGDSNGAIRFAVSPLVGALSSNIFPNFLIDQRQPEGNPSAFFPWYSESVDAVNIESYNAIESTGPTTAEFCIGVDGWI